MGLNRNSLVSVKEFKSFVFHDPAATAATSLAERFLNSVTAKFEQFTNRPAGYDKVDEYYDGTGTRSLILNAHPIQSIATLWIDGDRDWDGSALVNVTGDLLVYEDSGVITTWNNEGLFVKNRQNVRIIYRGGFNVLEVVSGANDRIDFKYSTATYAATLAAARYSSVQSLASHVQSRINGVAGLGSTLQCDFNYVDRKFKLKNSAGTTFELYPSSGTNKARSMLKDLGYDYRNDQTGSTEYTGSYRFFEVPDDLKQACIMQAAWWYRQSMRGDGWFGISSKAVEGVSVTNQFATLKILPEVKAIWNSYRKMGI